MDIIPRLDFGAGAYFREGMDGFIEVGGDVVAVDVDGEERMATLLTRMAVLGFWGFAGSPEQWACLGRVGFGGLWVWL